MTAVALLLLFMAIIALAATGWLNCFLYIILGAIWLDHRILTICNRFSHRLQRATGITCYGVAKAGLGISVITSIFILIDAFRDHHIPWAVLVLLALVMVFFVGDLVIRTHRLTKADEALLNGENIKPRWMRGHITAFLRLYWFALMILDIFQRDLLNGVWCLGLAVFYYFVAVNPLPPGTSKVREWIDNLFRKQVPVEVTNIR